MRRGGRERPKLVSGASADPRRRAVRVRGRRSKKGLEIGYLPRERRVREGGKGGGSRFCGESKKGASRVQSAVKRCKRGPRGNTPRE